MTSVAAGPDYARYRVAPPGHWLRKGVHAALAELVGDEVDQATAHLLDLVLRDALALTAATGDTCRFLPAASAIRQARADLRTGDVAKTRESLNAANYTLG